MLEGVGLGKQSGTALPTGALRILLENLSGQNGGGTRWWREQKTTEKLAST